MSGYVRLWCWLWWSLVEAGCVPSVFVKTWCAGSFGSCCVADVVRVVARELVVVCGVVCMCHVRVGLGLGEVSTWDLAGCVRGEELFVYFEFPVGIRARGVLSLLGLDLFNLVT